MAQLFGYHNSVGGGSSSAAGRGGETNEVTNEQADKNEEQTWQSIDRTKERKVHCSLEKRSLLPHRTLKA